MKQQENNAPLNAKGLTPTIAPTVKDEAGSTTKSAVSAGTVTITDKGNQKQDIKDLNRDTKNSLNKLSEIFDKEDVKERQELVNTFSEIAYEKAGDIAAEQGWSKNDSRRAILHGFIGSLTSAMGGGNALSGGLGAGTMEALQPVLDKYVKDYPWLREYASVIIGKAVGAIGNDQNAGAANALAGTRYNWLNHEQYEQYREELNKAKTKEEKAAIKEKWKVIDGNQKYEPLKGPGEYWDLANGTTYYWDGDGISAKLEPLIVIGLKNNGSTMAEGMLSGGINYRIVGAMGPNLPVGDVIFTTWDIFNDTDIDKYGITGVKRRIGLNITGAIIGISLSSKIPGLGSAIGINMGTGMGIGRAKDYVAPELTIEERKKSDRNAYEDAKHNFD